MIERDALAKVLYIADNWRYSAAANDWDGVENEGGKHPYFVMADALITKGIVQVDA